MEDPVTSLFRSAVALTSYAQKVDWQWIQVMKRSESNKKTETIQDIAKKIVEMRSHLSKGHQIDHDLDIDSDFGNIVDCLDSFYEVVDTLLDEYEGRKTNVSFNKPVNATQSPPMVAKWKSSKGQEYKLLHAQNILRPQLKFEERIDNSNKPWIPKIKHKDHATVELDLSIYNEKLNEEMSNGYPNPYEFEIKNLKFSPEMFVVRSEQYFKPLESTLITFVDTEEKLEKLLLHLKKQSEFAVDLEHHNYRSFMGFVCLMQISTREEDFIIDTILLRSYIHILNEVFANPNIVKVLHGADSDIVWLQRDFGIYVVNMFDTGQAARVLEFQKIGLAYLLNKYCNIDVDKKYQMADWRIRPLPTEMFEYARSDTHYLLYVYDKMRNELISKGNEDNNLMKAVLNRSQELCLKKFEKELYDENSYKNVYDKYSRRLDSLQLEVLKALYKWRDTVAREEDESPAFVLPNHMMLKMAEKVPTEVAAVIGCCSQVPPIVRQKAGDIAILVNNIKLSKPVEEEKKTSREKISIQTAVTTPRTRIFYDEDGEPIKIASKVLVSSSKNSKLLFDSQSDDENKAAKTRSILKGITSSSIFPYYEHLLSDENKLETLPNESEPQQISLVNKNDSDIRTETRNNTIILSEMKKKGGLKTEEIEETKKRRDKNFSEEGQVETVKKPKIEPYDYTREESLIKTSKNSIKNDDYNPHVEMIEEKSKTIRSKSKNTRGNKSMTFDMKK